MKKYYFITYQAKNNREDSVSLWNEVIDCSPMEFILNVSIEEFTSKNRYYRDFTIVNTCEITKDEFERFSGEF